MSTSPTGFQDPKLNWQAADVVGPSDFNRIEGNVNAIEQGSRTLDPAQAPTSNVGTLRQLLDWFANRIKAITGKANWYDAPDTTLAAAKSHFDAQAPHPGHALKSHTHAGSDITSAVANATNASYATSAGNSDKVDGCDAGTGPNNVLKLDSSGKVPSGNLPGGVFVFAGDAPYSGSAIARGETNTDNNTWLTVGPTGSGANIIWSALDAVPVGAKGVKLNIYTAAQHGNSASGPVGIAVRIRKNGSTITPWYASAAEADLLNEVSFNTNTVDVQLDSSRRFQIYWEKDDAVAYCRLYLYIYLEGWYL